MVNVSSPTIAVARARVEASYYLLRKAETLWLPDLTTGPAYYRHDGEIQNSTGIVFPTNKSNFFEGGGAFVTWDTSSVYFGPLIARRLYQAQTAAAQAVTNDVQLEAVITYLDLVRVHAALAINADTLARAEEMLQLSQRAQKEGLGTPVVVNRAQTEVNVRRVERIDLTGQAAVISAHLAQLLLLEPTVQLRPAEPPVFPVTLIPLDGPVGRLIALGLGNRPEMRESQALVGAAQARYQQARVTPFLPKLQVGYTSGVFGGGTDSTMANFEARGDGIAQAVWELHGLGLGDLAVARSRRSQVDEASFHVTEIQAQVAAEVVAAASQSITRLTGLAPAEDAVQQGIDMWASLIKQIKNVGFPARQYNPLDVLIAEQQLDQARVLYLTQVIEYNKSQFRLYWAIGQPPLCALPQATAVSVERPVVPETYQPAPLPPGKTPEMLGPPRPFEEKKN
jgi:outer membrane protein TolC